MSYKNLPEIYGFKLAEWGDRKCFNDHPTTEEQKRRWKRLEINSNFCFGFMKDDLPCGAWSIPAPGEEIEESK